MKQIIKIALSIIMGISIFGWMMSSYMEKIYTPTYLNQAVNQIDLMIIVQDQMDIEYENIKDTLMKSDDFKKMVYDYTYTFIYHLCGYNTTYTISDEQEEILFRQYSSEFLKKYPQLKFLPTDLFIDFLVERIDLNEYLPTFNELKQEIPSSFFYYQQQLTSSTFRYSLIASLSISFVLYCLLQKKLTLKGLILGLLMTILMLGYLLSLHWLIYLPQEYSFLENALIVLINELQVYLKYCIILFMGCLVLEWGMRYAKKIFLL